MPSRWMLTVASLLIFATTACGADAVSDASSLSPSAESPNSPAAMALAPVFGQEYHFTDGLTVLVGEPRPFKPSRTAYPRAKRAVGFDIVIRNDTERTYRLSGISISATIDGARSTQIIDSAQGYNGIGAGADLPVSREIRLTIAFSAGPNPADVTLAIAPNPTSTEFAHFTGHG